MDDIVKKVCEILDVKYSHYDTHMSDREYFPNMRLDSPVRVICYPGMAPWSFAILENLDVITPTSPFSSMMLRVYNSLKEIDDSDDIIKRYEETIGEVKEELERLNMAKEFLINNNFTWEGIPEKT